MPIHFGNDLVSITPQKQSPRPRLGPYKSSGIRVRSYREYHQPSALYGHPFSTAIVRHDKGIISKLAVVMATEIEISFIQPGQAYTKYEARR